jgi:hypothetical protein
MHAQIKTNTRKKNEPRIASINMIARASINLRHDIISFFGQILLARSNHRRAPSLFKAVESCPGEYTIIKDTPMCLINSWTAPREDSTLKYSLGYLD